MLINLSKLLVSHIKLSSILQMRLRHRRNCGFRGRQSVLTTPTPASTLSASMMNVSTFALADIGCRYKCAHEEIGIYRDIIKSASDLVAEIKDKLQKPVAGHLPSDDKAWIYGKVQQAEVLLAKANKIMKGMDKVAPQKRLRWVFQKRGVAESYKGAIFQCHVTLSQIRSSLVEMQNRGYGHVSSWMESDRRSPSRQIANAPREHPGLSNSFLVSPFMCMDEPIRLT